VKALVVRLSAVGDVIHTLPALAALKRHGYEVGWVVEPSARPLVEGNPLVSRVTAAPPARAFRLGPFREAVRALRGERYDVALDFQGLWKSAVWARLSGAPHVTGYGGPWRREPLSRVLIKNAMFFPPAVHVIDKNLALLRAVDISAVGLREFPLPPTGEAAAVVEARLATAGIDAAQVAVLNPGGGWESKLWPPSGFGEVARGLRERGLTPLVTWGPGEERLASRVVTASGGAAVMCFPTTLLELLELLRRVRLVVSADTGPLHLACALKTPVVGIYGPTDPARNGPFSPADVVVRRTPLCSPCHKKRCRMHEGAMEAITSLEVLRAIDRRLPPAQPPEPEGAKRAAV
jgi:lipopolysaccharide heptosyltransferase I